MDPNSLFLLLSAMIIVESGGNNAAYNPDEEAAGCLQIRPIFVQDINRILGRAEFTLDDRWDERRSRRMAIIYWTHYAAEERLGRPPTIEDLARIHNSGPDGWRDEPQWFVHYRKYSLQKAEQKIRNSKEYWCKVQREMERLKNADSQTD